MLLLLAPYCTGATVAERRAGDAIRVTKESWVLNLGEAENFLIATQASAELAREFSWMLRKQTFPRFLEKGLELRC